MGLLADNNRKQKWSLDPRNQNWKNESNKEDGSNLGANLMRKLGWKTGEGLGKNGQGMTINIKAHVKNNNYGIGMNSANQKDWVAGQEDFNAVLRMLNDEDTSVFKQDKLKVKRAIQRKSLSAKFVKAKDLSSSSKADMQALFGSAGGDIFSQMAAATATETKKEEAESSSSSSDSEDDAPVNKENPTIKDVIKSAEKNTTVSKVSTNDYFAKMMAKRGIKDPYAQPDLKKLGDAVDKAEVERVSFKKEVKPVGGIREWNAVVNAVVKTEEVEKVEKVEKDKKKKKKKRKAEAEEEVVVKEEVVEEVVEEVEEVEEEVISPPKKKKKKKNKSAEKEPEPVVESETEAVAEPAKKKKKKKKNKTKTDSE